MSEPQDAARVKSFMDKLETLPDPIPVNESSRCSHQFNVNDFHFVGDVSHHGFVGCVFARELDIFTLTTRGRRGRSIGQSAIKVSK